MATTEAFSELPVAFQSVCGSACVTVKGTKSNSISGVPGWLVAAAWYNACTTESVTWLHVDHGNANFSSAARFRKAKIGSGVLGRGGINPLPTSYGAWGSAESFHSGVRGGAPTAPKGFPLYSAFRMASPDTIILLILLCTIMPPLRTPLEHRLQSSGSVRVLHIFDLSVLVRFFRKCGF